MVALKFAQVVDANGVGFTNFSSSALIGCLDLYPLAKVSGVPAIVSPTFRGLWR